MIPDRYTRRGEQAPNAKLSMAQAREYRRRFQEGEPRPTVQSLADEAEISWSAMHRIVTGRSYRESEQ